MNIHRACVLGNLERVKYLIEEKGVNVNDVNGKHQCTPLMTTIFSEGKIPVIRYLLEKGASVNAVDSDEWTVLHYSANAIGETVHRFKLLVDAGANVYARSVSGRTVLHMAVCVQNMNIVQFILDHTLLDINTKDRYAHTPLSETSDIVMIQYLIRRGANPYQVCAYRKAHPFVLYAQKTYRARVCVLVLMSAKRIPQLGALSMIQILPTDLIRTLLSFFV